MAALGVDVPASSPALTVVIAAESPSFDGEVHRALLATVLGVPVRQWPHGMAFTGCKGVVQHSWDVLDRAETAGVRYALLSIDNDGGSARCFEHDPTTCVPPTSFDIKDRRACRECWVRSSYTALAKKLTWTGNEVVVVPVQAMETWLLHVQGHDFAGSEPEKSYSYARSVLKRRLYGTSTPSTKLCMQVAAPLLSRPDALDRLRERASFRRFEAAVSSWR